MKVYLDTSALIKLYYPEEESAALTAWVRDKRQPLLFSSLHEVELKNTFALKVFRNEFSKDQLKDTFDAVDFDLSKGVLQRMLPDWGGVFVEAIRLIDQHTPETGSWSLDILHVASAIAYHCTHFVTFDLRQSSLARVAGLEDIKISP